MESLRFFLVIIFFWILGLSIVVFRIKIHYDKLLKRTKRRNIDDILDFLLEKDENFSVEIKKIKEELEDLFEKEKFHYQKIGFLRFNPFDRVGGEQSFVLAFLDRENNGIVLNFLYTREGMRVYAKRVKQGISEEYELSTEEKEAIKKAK